MPAHPEFVVGGKKGTARYGAGGNGIVDSRQVRQGRLQGGLNDVN
jgi:hypothetical protein